MEWSSAPSCQIVANDAPHSGIPAAVAMERQMMGFNIREHVACFRKDYNSTVNTGATLIRPAFILSGLE